MTYRYIGRGDPDLSRARPSSVRVRHRLNIRTSRGRRAHPTTPFAWAVLALPGRIVSEPRARRGSLSPPMNIGRGRVLCRWMGPRASRPWAARWCSKHRRKAGPWRRSRAAAGPSRVTTTASKPVATPVAIAAIVALRAPARRVGLRLRGASRDATFACLAQHHAAALTSLRCRARRSRPAWSGAPRSPPVTSRRPRPRHLKGPADADAAKPATSGSGPAPAPCRQSRRALSPAWVDPYHPTASRRFPPTTQRPRRISARSEQMGSVTPGSGWRRRAARLDEPCERDAADGTNTRDHRATQGASILRRATRHERLLLSSSMGASRRVLRSPPATGSARPSWMVGDGPCGLLAGMRRGRHRRCGIAP